MIIKFLKFVLIAGRFGSAVWHCEQIWNLFLLFFIKLSFICVCSSAHHQSLPVLCCEKIRSTVVLLLPPASRIPGIELNWIEWLPAVRKQKEYPVNDLKYRYLPAAEGASWPRSRLRYFSAYWLMTQGLNSNLLCRCVCTWYRCCIIRQSSRIFNVPSSGGGEEE